jgi:hypothetical protein
MMSATSSTRSSMDPFDRRCRTSAPR